MQLDEVIRARRMVRRYTNEPVDPAVVERALGRAGRAPSAGAPHAGGPLAPARARRRAGGGPAVGGRARGRAVRAPSAGFTQGWAFLVLDEPTDVAAFWTAATPP